MTEGMLQRTGAGKELSSLGRSVDQFEKMFVETFEKLCDSRMDTLTFHLINHTVEDMRKTRPLSASYSSLYEHLNKHKK